MIPYGQIPAYWKPQEATITDVCDGCRGALRYDESGPPLRWQSEGEHVFCCWCCYWRTAARRA